MFLTLFRLDFNPTTKSLIRDVALASLKEFALSLCMVGVAAFFVASTSLTLFAVSAIGLIAINTLIRSGAAYYTADYLKTKDQTSLEIGNILQFLCPIMFSVLDSTTRQVLVHEMGHALATHLVYQIPKTTIKIFPFSGGEARYFSSKLTKIGDWLGKKTSQLVVSGAGPAFGILLASSDIFIAHKIKKEHPLLSRYLIASAIDNISEHVLYALSAFWTVSKPGHDFLALAAGGIHPAVAICTMVALPLIIKLSLLLHDRLSNEQKPILISQIH
ncbi:MAG: hypothetical protein WCJ72_14915 [Chryseobacterium sp.]